MVDNGQSRGPVREGWVGGGEGCVFWIILTNFVILKTVT